MSKPKHSPSKRRWTLGLVATLMLAGLGVAWFTHQSRGVDHAEAVQAEAAADDSIAALDVAGLNPAVAQTDDVAQSAQPTAAVAYAQPLPPDGTPLLEIFDELDARAKQGDAAAACRLGAELVRCSSATTTPRFGADDKQIAEMLANENASDTKVAEAAEFLMGIESGVLTTARICRGVDLSQLPNPQRYFHRAAMAGHLPSMMQFLTTTGNSIYDLFDDPGLIELYNRDGYKIFQLALRAGDPAILDHWSIATSNKRDALARLLPKPMRDPRLLEALRAQIDIAAPGVHRSIGRHPDHGEPSPEQLDQAEQMFQQYFAGSPRLGVKPADPFAGMMTGKLDRYRCTD